MSYDDIRPIFKAKFNSNIAFLLKSKEHIEEEENKAIESINETPAQKAAKRRKLNEEVEDLKRHLEIVPDEDDDVYTEATPLARKAKFNSNIAFLLKSKEHIEEEENKAIESINETPAQKAAKRRKLNEEVEDLKRHLEIVPDEDDDVYTEATPLARKVPVVDYEI
nr:hypothetical protein [Tanacetum cinerariifolium]